uniref:Magnesium transporter n=1 Tax=Globisporangium ultimum (strain ATCC 200006 / CBS 805.95 / DAOM BR144) TaxID=431595 RepID=K3WKQ0_GLOUD
MTHRNGTAADNDSADIVDATGASPRFVYHDMDVVVVQDHEQGLTEGDGVRDARRSAHQRMSTHSSFNENFETASAKEKRFACQFDPSLKNGRSLVLRFDMDGNSSFEEVSRGDVLRMTQEAATLALDHNNTGDAKRLVQSVKQTKLLGPTAYGTICDVQRVHARDIRKLDTAFSVSNEPSIELRNQAILINADPVRAIIMRNTCLVFVPDGADSLLSILRESFREATTQTDQGEAPYEFKALEALLSTLCRYFETDYEKRAPVVSTALDRLAHGKIAASELETLRVFKNTMNEFESQVDGVRRALMEILDNEEDLRLLYLTKLYEDPTLLNDLWSFDSEEAEVLIENYLQDIFSTRTKATLMQHRIQNTESLVMLKLDSMRNYLLGVDILFSIVAISVSVGTFIAGVFGMNLKSDLNERDGWFWGVTWFSVGIMFVIGFASYLFFRRKGVFI